VSHLLLRDLVHTCIVQLVSSVMLDIMHSASFTAVMHFWLRVSRNFVHSLEHCFPKLGWLSCLIQLLIQVLGHTCIMRMLTVSSNDHALSQNMQIG